MSEAKTDQVVDMRDQELNELRSKCEAMEREINNLRSGNMMLQETIVRMSMKLTGVAK